MRMKDLAALPLDRFQVDVAVDVGGQPHARDRQGAPVLVPRESLVDVVSAHADEGDEVTVISSRYGIQKVRVA